ncbi:hypothetical protein COO60DRAFT_1284916 [Scenedesmus sp. NREL 46B-D3]|nr:hypothetical protein COO60DRAFT_1284916 [Scenedesmus sp. NREL 46B-D3]
MLNLLCWLRQPCPAVLLGQCIVTAVDVHRGRRCSILRSAACSAALILCVIMHGGRGPMSACECSVCCIVSCVMSRRSTLTQQQRASKQAVSSYPCMRGCACKRVMWCLMRRACDTCCLATVFNVHHHSNVSAAFVALCCVIRASCNPLPMCISSSVRLLGRTRCHQPGRVGGHILSPIALYGGAKLRVSDNWQVSNRDPQACSCLLRTPPVCFVLRLSPPYYRPCVLFQALQCGSK